MKARQRVKLTGTNRSFDLIALVAKARDPEDRRQTSEDGRTLFRPPSLSFEKPVLLRSENGTTDFGRQERASLSVSVLRRLSADVRQPFFAGLVALAKRLRPDPIPNSAVKRFSANGTLSQDMGE